MIEEQLELEPLGWLAAVDYTHVYGPDIAYGAAREDALQKVLNLDRPVLLSTNRHLHWLLIDEWLRK